MKATSLQNSKGQKKNSAFRSVATYNPSIASTTEQLYEQMTSNPAFTKRDIPNANAYRLVQS